MNSPGFGNGSCGDLNQWDKLSAFGSGNSDEDDRVSVHWPQSPIHSHQPMACRRKGRLQLEGVTHRENGTGYISPIVSGPISLNAVARRLNERPRQTLNFESPAERFNQCVASTG